MSIVVEFDEDCLSRSSDENNIANQMIRCCNDERPNLTLDQIKQSVDQGSDPRADGDMAFTLACQYYDELTVPLYFIQLGADINANNGLALTNAIKKKRLAIVKMLLAHDIIVTNKHLKLAIVSYHKDIFSLLLSYIPNLDDRIVNYIVNHNRLLTISAFVYQKIKIVTNNDLSLYETILERGVDPDTLCEHYLQANTIISKDLLCLFSRYHVDINKMIDKVKITD